MKSLVINLLASWASDLSAFVDGDVFRETNIDLMLAALGDRLGYLKTTLDGKASLAGANTFTGLNTFDTSTTEFVVTGGGDARFAGGGLLDVEHTAVFRDDVTFEETATFEAAASFESFLGLTAVVGADSSGTIAAGVGVYRVPTLTANRTYGLPAIVAGDNRFMIFTRPGTESFTAGLSGIGVIPASQAGWIVAQARNGTWVPVMWSSNIASLVTTV